MTENENKQEEVYDLPLDVGTILYYELNATIDRVLQEFDINYPTLIGILEMLKVDKYLEYDNIRESQNNHENEEQDNDKE